MSHNDDGLKCSVDVCKGCEDFAGGVFDGEPPVFDFVISG